MVYPTLRRHFISDQFVVSHEVGCGFCNALVEYLCVESGDVERFSGSLDHGRLLAIDQFDVDFFGPDECPKNDIGIIGHGLEGTEVVGGFVVGFGAGPHFDEAVGGFFSG